MNWTELMFGKHAGKTLPQVVFADPDWFFWAYECGALERHGMQDEAEAVYSRATRIRIPQDDGQSLVAEYALCHKDGRFANVELVLESRPLHQGSSPTMRLPVFDLSVPRRFCAYDKSGCRALVDALKVYLFGDPDYRLTKQHCARFFENDANFVL
ncbi:MAG: hypothetical protein NT154_39315 [Verrucomicrobia bacterium]|nr:hypothetical protein [Verrucomicrobiota bacterium]